MKVVGFTIIKNAVLNGYPITEAIMSILPLCDEFIVVVGKGEDNTKELIQNIKDIKIKIFDSEWDPSIKKGGHILSIETSKAYRLIPDDADWCFYIQADEIIHEKDHNIIYKEMEKWKDDVNVDGLLFNYLHFYGSYDYLATSYKWYRREARIIRKSKKIYSYHDAQGFRKNRNQKINVRQIDASVYHYGWVRPPKKMQRKLKNFMSLYFDDYWVKQNISDQEEFDYSGIDHLIKFQGSHPSIMESQIESMDWDFDYNPDKSQLKLKDRFKRFVEKNTGYRIGEFKNYRII